MAASPVSSPLPAVRGFTLTEILVALLMTAILVSLAVPAYREHQVKVHRTAALQALQTARHCESSQRLQGNSDPGNRCTPAPTPYYRYLFVAAEGAYEWRAEPRGMQMGDACGTLALDHLGGKQVLGSAQSPQACWRGR